MFKNRKAHEESIPTTTTPSSCARQTEEITWVRSFFSSSTQPLIHDHLFHRMPSTHSAVITYYAAYTLLACLRLPIHSSLPASPLTRIVAPMIILPWSAIVAVSRIWLRHHTWPQVVVGCANGLVFAPLWFHLWTHGASRYGYFLEQAYFVW